jgi:hypothetical protein
MLRSLFKLFTTTDSIEELSPIAVISDILCKNYIPFNQNSNEFEIDNSRVVLNISDSNYKLYEDYIDKYMEQNIFRLYYPDYDIENQKYIDFDLEAGY